MEAEGRNEPPSDGEFRPQTESVSKCPHDKGIQRRMLLTPEDGGSHVRLSKKRKQQEGMRQDGVRSESEPSSSGEDERMTESPSNACPIPTKKKKNNRTDTGGRVAKSVELETKSPLNLLKMKLFFLLADC